MTKIVLKLRVFFYDYMFFYDSMIYNSEELYFTNSNEVTQ